MLDKEEHLCNVRMYTYTNIYLYKNLKVRSFVSPVDHFLLMKVLQSIQNLSCVSRDLRIPQAILLIKTGKWPFCYELKEDINPTFILELSFYKQEIKSLIHLNKIFYLYYSEKRKK